ncbi:capsule biosynthesis protein [Aliishimia ponticola]|uniref:Capsule biosynthesis protein n=1 Tax=Aliishimia ponticola TaxID=2499833 RepID=A0A4S4NIR8_9RHOB|nr:capsule biosynthesis protein [Aliishimia ponticola]THH35990.1 capsule biosynthesis protein [Aliishimia ponticola]
MTTKPKARKFRIRRSMPRSRAESAGVDGSAVRAQPVPDPAPHAAEPPEAPRVQQTGAKPAAAQPQQPPQANQQAAPSASAQATGAPSTDLDAIRREGLTGRQLRMARRVAQKHGLAPTSDFDAVRLLRDKGIDPFQRSNMLELVAPKPDDDGAQDGSDQTRRTQLPQTVPAGGGNLPSTETISPAQRREREISDIQRDIARRRRRKMALLVTRLLFFVFLPTFFTGWYFYKIATPMYATHSEFLIIQNEGSGGGGALGGLLPTQFATSQDSIAVQSYLTSKDAMLRLDRDEGFRAHFADTSIDPIQRLSEEPSTEEAHRAYKKNVKIGFDPTEGVIRMEVVAADPAVSQSFSEALISYAEERVNQLSAQKREDQMRDALEALAKAEEDRREAQGELVALQIEGATLDPEAVIAALRTQISEINGLITEKEIELDTLLNNTRPNQAKVDGARSTLNILRNRRSVLEAEMTDMSQGENSLAQLSINIQMAQADLATRDMMLQSALQQMEQARTEANRQVRYLTVAVRPVAPDEATYPRAFENTILAFMVFAGIYLMISLTGAILKEQVSS